MVKQILLIRGGEVFDTYEEYLSFLRNKKLTLEDMKFQDWKKSLGEILGADYDVILPQMPSVYYAHYVEWKIWFEKIIPLLDSEIILIGSSLGGIFLLKYLSENDFPKKIQATFLVASPYKNEEKDSLGDFRLTKDLDKFVSQAGEIHLYQSRDDQVVPFSDFLDLKKALPCAKTRIFEDRGHFRQAEFPEIIEDIKSVS